MWPTANVGIAVPEGYVVVDIDGPDGDAVLDAAGYVLPPTVYQTTGRGTHHLYRTARKIAPRVAVVPHVDLRGPGSYIVAEPSRHANGATYRWHGKLTDAADAPAWLAGFADQRPTPTATTPGEPIPDGQRNAALASLAGTMRRRGMTELAILAALLTENAERCQPPLAESEVRTIAASVARYQPANIPAASGGVGASTRKSPTFRTAREVAAMTAGDLELAAPFLPFGCLTELDGRPKAAGKTTYTLSMARAILDGAPFLGQPTTPGPVVLLTEQPPASIRASLVRAGLAQRDDLSVLLWAEAAGTPWPDLVALAAARAREVGSRVLIVDTLPQFAGLRGDSENDSGAALQALEPLQGLAADGFAVWLNRHDRKGGGEIGESARGSGAFTGAVDIVLALSRDAHDLRPTMRRLLCLSRFDAMPPDLMLELVDGQYVVLGSIDGVRASALADLLLGLLPGPDETPVTPEALTDAADKDGATIKQALNGLRVLDPSPVLRHGAGRKGDPFRWSLATRDGAVLSGAVLRTQHHQKETADPIADLDPGEDANDDTPPPDGWLV